jgi:hypothetical protein
MEALHVPVASVAVRKGLTGQGIAHSRTLHGVGCEAQLYGQASAAANSRCRASACLTAFMRHPPDVAS